MTHPNETPSPEMPESASPDPLSVPCGYCRAQIGEPCTNLMDDVLRETAHPSRVAKVNPSPSTSATEETREQVHGVTWLVFRDGNVLLERCPKKAAVLRGGEWFVPGGKLEAVDLGEPWRALHREVGEEWPGVTVLSAHPLPILAGSPIPPGPRGLFLMQPYVITPSTTQSIPSVSADGVELRWIPIDDALASPVPQVRMMVAAAVGHLAADARREPSRAPRETAPCDENGRPLDFPAMEKRVRLADRGTHFRQDALAVSEVVEISDDGRAAIMPDRDYRALLWAAASAARSSSPVSGDDSGAPKPNDPCGNCGDPHYKHLSGACRVDRCVCKEFRACRSEPASATTTGRESLTDESNRIAVEMHLRGWEADGHRTDAERAAARWLLDRLPMLALPGAPSEDALRAGAIACASERNAARDDGRRDDAKRWERYAAELHAAAAQRAQPASPTGPTPEPTLDDLCALTPLANLFRRVAHGVLKYHGATFASEKDAERVAGHIAVAIGMNHGLADAVREFLADVDPRSSSVETGESEDTKRLDWLDETGAETQKEEQRDWTEFFLYAKGSARLMSRGPSLRATIDAAIAATSPSPTPNTATETR